MLQSEFDKAFETLMKVEGGYVNDKDDAGGETYCGISRRSHPDSLLWKYVDDTTKKYNKPAQINKILSANKEVTNIVKDLYKKLYWNPFDLDNKPYTYKMKYQLFDSAVNIGVKKTNELFKHIK